MASTAETSVKPTRIPSSSVIGIAKKDPLSGRQLSSASRLSREPAIRVTRSNSMRG